MKELNNNITICGKLITEPIVSHEINGERFYEATVSIDRDSGTTDILPITISERLVQDYNFKVGFILNAEGQIRSYNKLIDGKSRLKLTVFIINILDSETIHSKNIVELNGYLCKNPTYRKTPLGREITDLLVAVNRSYNKSDYIPCIVWGRTAKAAANLKIGDAVHLQGRFQSRNYQKQVNDVIHIRTAYEVSANIITHIANQEQQNER